MKALIIKLLFSKNESKLIRNALIYFNKSYADHTDLFWRGQAYDAANLRDKYFKKPTLLEQINKANE